MLRKLYPNVYLFLRVEPLPVHGKPRFVRVLVRWNYVSQTLMTIISDYSN